MRNVKRVFWFALLGSILLCCEDDGKETVTIGPEGGAFYVLGGVSLRIPPGALDREVDFSIQEAEGTLGGVAVISLPFAFQPHGTAFSVPATVMMEYDEHSLNLKKQSPDEVRIMWGDTITGPWQVLSTEVDPTYKRVTAVVGSLAIGVVGVLLEASDEACSDFLDNDGDALHDCNDPDCQDAAPCLEDAGP